MTLLADLRRELERSEPDRETRAPTSDLQWVTGVLKDAEAALSRGDRPKVPASIGRLVADRWNLTSPLSNRVVEFVQRHGSE